MRIRILTILGLILVLINNLAGQNETKSNDFDQPIFELNHQLLIGTVAGKRSQNLNHRLSVQYLSTLNYNKHDLGLGVGFENENYFNLLPAYFFYSYNFWKKNNLPQPFTEIGLAFNTEREISFSNSIPGIFLSAGLIHSVKLTHSIALQIKCGYRYQETSTLRLLPTGGAQPPNENLVKHQMHRIQFMVGIKF